MPPPPPPPSRDPVEPPRPEPTGTSSSNPKARKRSFSNLTNPFALFRSQTVPAKTSSPVRRKPLPATASPVAGRFSSSEFSSPLGSPNTGRRSFSVDSQGAELLLKTEQKNAFPTRSSSLDTVLQIRDLDKYPHQRTNTLEPLLEKSPVPSNRNSQQPDQSADPAQPSHDRRRSNSSEHIPVVTTAEGVNFRDGLSTPIEESPPFYTVPGAKKASPGKKLTSFFGWKTTRSPSVDSPTTTIPSEHSFSPAASPVPGYANSARSLLAPLDVPKANASAQHTHYIPPGTPFTLSLPTPPPSNAQMAELELELQEISAELAQSVRREMELEDELERLRAERAPPSGLEADRRTSDYYSDSGAGSVRYILGDSEGRIEELETLRRRAEQEKAQVKVDMSQRLEQALRQKRVAEDRLREVQDVSRRPSIEDGSQIRELELALEEARRKTQEERQSRESYESLIAGMRLELEQCRNERDNLRDEVVAQLRAKVEGLENEVAGMQSLTYENSRMQQEIDGLRAELQSARSHRIKSITEEDREPTSLSSTTGGLTRSMSLMSKRGGMNSRSRSNSVMARPGSVRDSTGLSRANSVKEQSQEPREVLAQKVKELQEQRDALHSAVKNLILRHVHMEKEHAKRLKALEKERDSAINVSPRRSAFHDEVRNLREEITVLRRRADDALNQKWQCEKGLGGLKMDLDRAQQETTSLRKLLQERDMFASERPGSRNGQQHLRTDISLDKAYDELRTTQALSIASIRELEANNAATGEAQRVLELLKQSISGAEAERDFAMSQADSYREEARKLQQSELEHLNREQSLSSELYASAKRMDELATQVQQQIKSNSQLRSRLAEAIARGEEEQHTSTERIAELQGQLRDLEDKLVHAQQHSEDIVASHEDEVRQIQLSHNAQLQRAKSGLLSPGHPAPTSPVTPIFALKSPRLDKTSSGNGMSIAEASRAGFLETKVKELETALANAEKEMQEVVGRMNQAQIEVAELQGERDEAMMRTKRLQAEIISEREKVKELMEASSAWPDDY